MIISVPFSKQEEALIKQYAKKHNITVSDLITQTVLEKIEDEYDLELFRNSLAEFEKNPVTYSFDEVCNMLDIKSTF